MYCIVATKGKTMGFNHIDWFYSIYIMSSCLKRYSVRYELNTIDACWIAVDWWSNSSRCRQESIYLSWTWCLYMWSLPWIRHNYALFYQLPNSNLFTHHMLCVRERSLLWKLWPRGLLLSYIKSQKYLAAIYLLLFYLIFYFSIHQYQN